MHDATTMEIAEGHDDLCANKFDSWFLEATNFVDIVVNVATWKVLEEEVDFKLVLEHKVHRIDEGVVRLEQDILLVLDVLDLLLLQQ